MLPRSAKKRVRANVCTSYLSQLSSYVRGHAETLSYPPTRVIPLNYHASHTRVRVTHFGYLETKGNTVCLCIESVRFATELPEQRQSKLAVKTVNSPRYGAPGSPRNDPKAVTSSKEKRSKNPRGNQDRRWRRVSPGVRSSPSKGCASACVRACLRA